MRIVIIRCASAPLPASLTDQVATIVEASAVPTRDELRALDAAAHEVLPYDPTPSLDAISAQPDVSHLGAPARPPQHPAEELRVIVVGSDAALSAVATRMMRGDYLWATLAYVPTQPSTVTAAWGLSGLPSTSLARIALTTPATPLATIRNDAGLAVLGSATITADDGGGFEGEIIVDDARLVARQTRPDAERFFGVFGAKLAPTPDAPGIAAMRLTTPVEAPSGGWRLAPERAQALHNVRALRWLTGFVTVRPGGLDADSLLTGRAVQAAGNRMRVTIDGVPGRRPVKRVTFYRHLRDLQAALGPAM
ncbi:hypothetical protein [Corynebacterium uterequi]|uniref:Uncharacterized protein n=1 Tax=Corynebacterium uterequi TaxID=1072256 RepID=A0A0G3HF46_9CORY|nr:hypothetical protein [Corynebacterium uterequi]AKK11924.1 hypothetical protein CUTER_09780 [Corynebacterium uterequi]